MDTLDFNFADDEEEISGSTLNLFQTSSDEVNLGIIDVADQNLNSVALHPGDVLNLSDLVVSDVETLDTALKVALTEHGIDSTSKLAFIHGDDESRVNLVNDDSHQWSQQPVAEVTSASGNAYNVYTSEGAVALVDVNLTVIHS